MTEQQLKYYLSSPRFNVYLANINGDFDKAYWFYKVNIELSEAFYPILSVLEVSLRNAVNEKHTKPNTKPTLHKFDTETNSKTMWWIYALLSALFASLTAIFGKLGVANINSNLATGLRTVVILIMIWSIVLARGETKGMGTLSKQNLIFLTLSGLATGLSWLFYFKVFRKKLYRLNTKLL